MRPTIVILNMLIVEMAAETGSNYTFKIRKNARKVEFHIIKAIGGDDGFALYRLCKYGVQWDKDPIQAVEKFYNDRNKWLIERFANSQK